MYTLYIVVNKDAKDSALDSFSRTPFIVTLAPSSAQPHNPTKDAVALNLANSVLDQK